ncbi:MAG TPA: hypothetical protein P5307_14450 [Pirellulaceae bacterium]|nr:hypothetical protein [Planctomycetales bacterium]MCB9938733.1 hypothetical protein [Planctomycetaceae bacterium]HRX80267.1 hypothetical protein [Pirellulaceae bacterium]
MQVLMWIAIIGIGAILLTGVIWLLHRFAIRLEEAGYIYYREQPRGGGGSVFGELDRLVRPSIQHTIDVKDVRIEQAENDGE